VTRPLWATIDEHAPREFVGALLAVMPDAVTRRWAGSSAYFPCDDPAALSPEQRLFHARPGSRPDLPYELALALPAGAAVVVGTWQGAALPGGRPSGGRRVWVMNGARSASGREKSKPPGPSDAAMPR